jgi:putative membrane protein
MMIGSMGEWLIGALWFLLLVVAAAAVVIFLLRRGGSDLASRVKSDPHAVLDLRFARGEIDVEEYRFRRDMLEEGRSAGVVQRPDPR